MSIRELDNMSNKGTWIPIKGDNYESLEDGEEDGVNNGEYYIQFYHGNYPNCDEKFYLVLFV